MNRKIKHPHETTIFNMVQQTLYLHPHATPTKTSTINDIITTPRVYQTTHILQEAFSFHMFQTFAIMPSYKTSIIFLDGQGIHIFYFFNKEYFSFYIKENPYLSYQGKIFHFISKKLKPKLIRNLRQYST